MVKENPNKESCRERMKELIRVKKLNRNQVVKRCMREFDDVHKSTFYGWYDEVINEPDIVSWKRKEGLMQYLNIKKNMNYQKGCLDVIWSNTISIVMITKIMKMLKY